VESCLAGVQIAETVLWNIDKACLQVRHKRKHKAVYCINALAECDILAECCALIPHLADVVYCACVCACATNIPDDVDLTTTQAFSRKRIRLPFAIHLLVIY